MPYLNAECKILRLDVFFSSCVVGNCFFKKSKHSFKWALLCFSSLLWTSLVPALKTIGGCFLFDSLPLASSMVKGFMISKLLLRIRCLGNCWVAVVLVTWPSWSMTLVVWKIDKYPSEVNLRVIFDIRSTWSYILKYYERVTPRKFKYHISCETCPNRLL